MTDKKYPSKEKNWVTFDLLINLRKLLDSKRFTKEEFEYIALEEALNKIEAIPEKRKGSKYYLRIGISTKRS